MILALLLCGVRTAVEPPPTDESFYALVKELVELNGTVSEPKRYTLVVDVQTMQARREERSHDNERSQITLYNATTQLVLIPRGASDYDCIKLHIPSDNSTEPFSYAIVDDSAVLVDKNATLPPLGPRSAAAMLAAKGAPPHDGGAIELWAHNRTYSGGVVQLLEWYLEERVVPGRVAASLRSASSSGRAGDDADWRSTAATSAAGSSPSRELVVLLTASAQVLPAPTTATVGFRVFEHLANVPTDAFDLPAGVNPSACIGGS